MAVPDTNPGSRTVGALLFPQFELLEIFGPLEMFGALTKHFTVVSAPGRGCWQPPACWTAAALPATK